jgi:predicted lipoprotein with Yx(FWY)xxD motif
LESYHEEPLPPGFGVQHTDVDGPVFVDSQGMTLYIWPSRELERGTVGDHRGQPSTCGDSKYTENSGFDSLYAGGFLLPDLDTRPTCAQLWPPVLAAPDSQKIGKWTVMNRPDGRSQWAYNGFPLYTSVLDTKPGQVNGGFRHELTDAFAPPFRKPVGPPPLIPPEFTVRTVTTGRILLLAMTETGSYRDESEPLGLVIYSWDGDRPNKSNCSADCTKEWSPVAAAQSAQPQGEWGVIERSPGLKQWTYRGKPLYTRAGERVRTVVGARGVNLQGNDEPGWHSVYAQKWPKPPKEFTVRDSRIGQVLADKRGMTLYTYFCADDALDQLSCDHPTTTQAYRLAICGRGVAAVCNELFPYVPAPIGVKIDSLIWGTAWIDPQTGHYATPHQPGAFHVWTFRDRPIYTHGHDRKPGDANGDSWGEMNGYRNGYKAFWIRDDFFGSAD